MPKTFKPKRPTMKRAKKMLARRKKSMAKKNMDTYFLRTRITASILPSQGITVSNYISSFWKLLDQTSAVGVTQSSEFTLFSNIYDRVRVNRMRIRVVPKANVLDQATAQNDANLTVSGDGRVHTAIYRDPDGFSTSVSRFQRQPSYRAYSVLKPFTRSYQIKYPTGVWLNCQDIYSDETLLQRLGAYGGVGLYAENVLEDAGEIFNEPWASLEISYDCVFQGKVSAVLTQDESGNVCIAPPTATTVAPSRIVGISGTFNDTHVTGIVDGEVQEAPKNDASDP